MLEKCDLELIALSQDEVANFLKIAPIFKQTTLSKSYYNNLENDLKTISSETILASRDGLNPKVSELIKNVLLNHQGELIKEAEIFRSFLKDSS